MSHYIEWSHNKNYNECAWCFERLQEFRISAYNFTFCSHNCAFRHKEFEDQFKEANE